MTHQAHRRRVCGVDCWVYSDRKLGTRDPCKGSQQRARRLIVEARRCMFVSMIQSGAHEKDLEPLMKTRPTQAVAVKASCVGRRCTQIALRTTKSRHLRRQLSSSLPGTFSTLHCPQRSSCWTRGLDRGPSCTTGYTIPKTYLRPQRNVSGRS